MKAANPLGFGKPPPKDLARDIHIHGGCPPGYFNGEFVPALAALGYNDKQGLENLWFPQAGRAGPTASKARPTTGPTSTGRQPTSNPQGLEAGRPVTAGRVPRLEMAPEDALNAEEYQLLQEEAGDQNGNDEALLIFPPLRDKIQTGGPKLPPQLAHSAAVAAALGKRSIGGGSGRLPFSLSMGAQGADLRLVMEVEALEDMERRVKEEEDALEKAAQMEAERRYQQRLTHQLQRHRMGISAAEAAEYDARMAEYIGSGPPTRSQYKAQLEQQKKEGKRKGGSAPKMAGGISKKDLAEAEREEALQREAAARRIESGVRGAVQGRRTTVIIDAIRDREVAAAAGLADELLAVEADFDATQDYYYGSPTMSSPSPEHTQRPGVLNLRGGASSVSSAETPEGSQAWSLGRWRYRRSQPSVQEEQAKSTQDVSSSRCATLRSDRPFVSSKGSKGSTANEVNVLPELANFVSASPPQLALAAVGFPDEAEPDAAAVRDPPDRRRTETASAVEPLESVVEVKRGQNAQLRREIERLHQEHDKLQLQLLDGADTCRACDLAAETLSCTLKAERQVCQLCLNLAEERQGTNAAASTPAPAAAAAHDEDAEKAKGFLRLLASLLETTQREIRSAGGQEDHEVTQLADYLGSLL